MDVLERRGFGFVIGTLSERNSARRKCQEAGTKSQTTMATRRQVVLAVLGAVGFFLLVQLGTIALLEPFQQAGYQAVENPQDPTNTVFYIGILLAATAVMLLLFRFSRTGLLRAFLVLTSGLISAYVFSVLLPPDILGISLPVHGGALLGAIVVMAGLTLYPEWWVIDASAAVMGMGAAALFGISFDLLPALLLLLALAIYDAISVYGTEHMLTLASGVMELRVPVVVVIPTSLSYSFIEMAEDMAADVDGSERDEKGKGDGATEKPRPTEEETAVEAESTDESEPLERDAFFIGLGDAVIPTILVATATVFLDTPAILGIEAAALGALIGTLLGLLVLLWMVMKGRAHAGLPLLNGGAIVGYLLAALASGVSLVEALGVAGYF